MVTEELEEKINNELQRDGIQISGETTARISRYMAGILEMNKKVNLTSISSEDDFIRLNIADSLSLLNVPEFTAAEKVIDVGTGAGFPGAVLAIACPKKVFVLLDARSKRLEIVKALLNECGAKNASFVHARSEDAARDEKFRENFDVCLSRAVAPLNVLAELTAPFIKTGGYLIAHKGRGAAEESKKSQNAFSILGLGKPDILDAGVSDTEHCIIVSKKQETTRSRYPRKAGIPSKKPL